MSILNQWTTAIPTPISAWWNLGLTLYRTLSPISKLLVGGAVMGDRPVQGETMPAITYVAPDGLVDPYPGPIGQRVYFLDEVIDDVQPVDVVTETNEDENNIHTQETTPEPDLQSESAASS